LVGGGAAAGSGSSSTAARLKAMGEAGPSGWLSRGDLVLLIDRAPGRGRRLTNAPDAFRALRRAFGGQRPLLRVVTDSKVPYLAQYALWRAAALVVSVHGGNLGGALWLSPGQALIELGFGGCAKSPTQFAHAAVANGARYRCLELGGEGVSRDDGGSVDVAALVARAAELLLPPQPRPAS
jgi:hypothetical protein